MIRITTLPKWVFLTCNKPQNPVLLAIESAVEVKTTFGRVGDKTVRFSEVEHSEEFKPVQIHRQTSAGLDRKEKEKGGRKSGFRGLLKKFKGQNAESNKNLTDATKSTVVSQDSLPVRAQILKPAKPPVLDLGSVPDLCLSILETSRGVVDSSACVGYLTDGTDRYMVYTRQAAPSNLGSGTTSLSKMIASHRRQQNLPKSDKWRLAGALSLAVLLYHSTPWLQSELKSEDILFFDSDDQEHQASLKAPHLHYFQRHKGKAPEKSLLSKDGLIKNEMLHCLGVVLLEIEFEDTLESLILDSTLGGVPDIQQMILLKRRAGRELGTLYGRIIRMCLDCDFGLGYVFLESIFPRLNLVMSSVRSVSEGRNLYPAPKLSAPHQTSKTDWEIYSSLDEYNLDDSRVQKVFYSQVVRQFQERMPEYNKIWSDE